MTHLNATVSALLIGSLSVFGQAALAQAFGIAPGAPLNELENLEPLDGGNSGVYYLTVPSPHPEFQRYAAKAHPETGVCILSGYGKYHENDRFGLSVQKAFSELQASLEQKYKGNSSYDYLRDGALWDSSGEWVMSVHMNERVRHVSWKTEFGSKLPDELSEINLAVFAGSATKSWVGLTYRFANSDRCNALISSEQESGL